MTTTTLPRRPAIDPRELQLSERVVSIRRVAKVVAGGRHLTFSAMVVVGDGKGHVGAGTGKAGAVPDAIRKATAAARRDLIQVPLKGTTLHHEVQAQFGASRVLLKPASPGTGVIAGSSVRAVVELAGFQDIVTKCHGSSNPLNVVRVTLKALAKLRDPQQVVAQRLGQAPAQEQGRG